MSERYYKYIIACHHLWKDSYTGSFRPWQFRWRYLVARWQIHRGRSPKMIADGKYDCTAALQAAIDAHFPLPLHEGVNRISSSIDI